MTRPRYETVENETNETNETRGGMRDAGCGMRDAKCEMRNARCEMQEATMTMAISINPFIVQSNFQTPISK
jgi:hypothetical protein